MKNKKLILLGVVLLSVVACSLSGPLNAIFPGVMSTLTPFSFQPLAFLNTATPAATVTPLPPTATASPRPTPLISGMVMRDVIYCTMDGQPLTMDIFFPSTGYGPWPVIINIHGGAWVAGSKLLVYTTTDITPLIEAGYITISVNYRLAPENPFPDMIEDLKCSVRYLRAHAAEYNLDPNRIGVRGGSAGGHLASLMGASDASAGWDVGEYLDQSSRVQAVVDINGPTTLTDPSFLNSLGDVAKQLLKEPNPTTEMLARASPTTYITPDDPPFLILYGDMDRVVAAQQSLLLYNGLIAAGVPAQLVVVQNGNHMLNPSAHSQYTVPSSDQIMEIIIAFLDKYLKPAP
jgi:acetyl esterase/lipase